MSSLERCVFFACLLPIALPAAAQDRKPGVYDLTITTTTVSPSAKTYLPRTSQVCLTQEMIDTYGAIVPDRLTQACQLVNVVKKRDGMTADLVCSGGINGKGTLEVSWTDSEHAKGNLHFSGTMHPRDTDIKLEWSATSTSAYKGPNCSLLNPPTPPAPPPTNP